MQIWYILPIYNATDYSKSSKSLGWVPQICKLAKSLMQVTECHLHECLLALHWVHRQGTHPSTITDWYYVYLQKYTLPRKKRNFNFQILWWPWIRVSDTRWWGFWQIVIRSILEMTFGPKFTDLHSSPKERKLQKSCVSFGEDCTATFLYLTLLENWESYPWIREWISRIMMGTEATEAHFFTQRSSSTHKLCGSHL